MSTPPIQPLPVRELVSRTYQDVYVNREGLVRIGLPWLIGPFVLGVLGTAMEGIAVSLIADLVSLLGLSAMAVAWHRHVILGQPLAGPFAPVTLTVGRYLLFGLLVSVLAAVPGIVIVIIAGATGGIGEGGRGLLSTLVMGAAFLAAVIVFARLQLVFPGIAIGDPAGLRGSWQLTSGNGTRLFGGILLTVLPVILAVVLAQLIAAAFDAVGAAKAGAFLALLASSVGAWLQAPLVAAFLSFSYLWFRAATGEPSPETA